MVTNSPMPLRLSIKPAQRWYSSLYLLYVGILLWFELQHRRFDFAAWFPLLIIGLSLLEYLTHREELEFHEDRVEWRKMFAGFASKTARRYYSEIDSIEWHEVRYFPGFSNPRHVAFAGKGLKPLKAAVGSSKEDLAVIREQLRLMLPALVDKFEFPDERECATAQEG